MPVCSLTWFLARFLAAAPHAPEAAGVLFTSSFRATLSIGALTGGLVVDRSSPATVMVLGGVVALLAAALVRGHGHRVRPDSAAPGS
ncbi:hypothetical protein ADK60_22695 [Streptomyces sp. XY431]|nr:hypothetical protein ADK60_22695 [Streptomyces sp. XY431]